MYIKTVIILLKPAVLCKLVLKKASIGYLNELSPFLLWLFWSNDWSLTRSLTVLPNLGCTGNSAWHHCYHLAGFGRGAAGQAKPLVKKCLLYISSSQLMLNPWAYSPAVFSQPICHRGIQSFCFVFYFLSQTADFQSPLRSFRYKENWMIDSRVFIYKECFPEWDRRPHSLLYWASLQRVLCSQTSLHSFLHLVLHSWGNFL